MFRFDPEVKTALTTVSRPGLAPGETFDPLTIEIELLTVPLPFSVPVAPSEMLAPLIVELPVSNVPLIVVDPDVVSPAES